MDSDYKKFAREVNGSKVDQKLGAETLKADLDRKLEKARVDEPDFKSEIPTFVEDVLLIRKEHQDSAPTLKNLINTERALSEVLIKAIIYKENAYLHDKEGNYFKAIKLLEVEFSNIKDSKNEVFAKEYQILKEANVKPQTLGAEYAKDLLVKQREENKSPQGKLEGDIEEFENRRIELEKNLSLDFNFLKYVRESWKHHSFNSNPISKYLTQLNKLYRIDKVDVKNTSLFETKFRLKDPDSPEVF